MSGVTAGEVPALLEAWASACVAPMEHLAALLEHTGGAGIESCPTGAAILHLVEQHTLATARLLGYADADNPLQEWCDATNFGTVDGDSLAELLQTVLGDAPALR